MALALKTIGGMLLLLGGDTLGIHENCCCSCLCTGLVRLDFEIPTDVDLGTDCIQATSSTNDRIKINDGAGGKWGLTRSVSRHGGDTGCDIVLASASIAGAGPKKTDFSGSTCGTDLGSSTSVRLDISTLGCNPYPVIPVVNLDALEGTVVAAYNNVGLGAMYLYGHWEFTGDMAAGIWTWRADNELSGYGYANRAPGYYHPAAGNGGYALLEAVYA